MGAWDWTNYIPGVDNTKQLLQGNFGKALDPADFAVNAYGAIKNAYDKPFDEKRQAYDQVGQMSQEIQQKRMQRQQDILRQTLAARDPERNAINAVYGDPRQWKL